MNCETYTDWILEAVDGSLPAGQHAALDAHLAACHVCAQALSEHRALDGLLKARLEAPRLPSCFAASFRRTAPRQWPAVRLPAWLDWFEPVAQFATVAMLAQAFPRLWAVFLQAFSVH